MIKRHTRQAFKQLERYAVEKRISEFDEAGMRPESAKLVSHLPPRKLSIDSCEMDDSDTEIVETPLPKKHPSMMFSSTG